VTLDNTNVAKVANYNRTQVSESDTFQFIVISLMGSLYQCGNSLVGIHHDQDLNSARTLTLDVSTFRSSGIWEEANLSMTVHAIRLPVPHPSSLASPCRHPTQYDVKALLRRHPIMVCKPHHDTTLLRHHASCHDANPPHASPAMTSAAMMPPCHSVQAPAVSVTP